ncbi:coiled-coil domain-containing protein 3a [Menidia menidia]
MPPPALLLTLCVLARVGTFARGCQLPSSWRPQSEACRAELAEIIVYARVLALHREPLRVHAGSLHNSLPFGFGYGPGGAEEGLLYSAEVELLCDQAWGSMLEVPAGSRLNLTGLGYLSCQSHTVMENYSYFFFLRMDENYSILPHGVNFQDAIFPDTAENRRTFSSLFQFSNCSQGSHPFHSFSPEWDSQEDSRLLCSSLLLGEGRGLQRRLEAAERRNRQLKERVRKVKRSLKKSRRAAQQAALQVRELRGKLEAAQRRAGLHLNAITQQDPPAGGFTSPAVRL